MRLLADIIITIDGATVTLRPSLRAGYRLETRYGFKTLTDGIVGGDPSIISAVIRETGDYPDAVLAVIDEIDQIGIVRLNPLTNPLLDLIFHIYGHDPDQPEQKPAKKQKPRLPIEYFNDLYKIATGWLGWSNSDAWSASPAQINAAQAGLIERFNAFHGSASGKKDRQKMSLAERVKLTMANLSDRAAAKEGK